MFIWLELEDPGEPFGALELARLMCDVQHLVTWSIALTNESLAAELDLTDAYQNSYHFMVEADLEKAYRPTLRESRVTVETLCIASPLKIKFSVLSVSGKFLSELVRLIETISTLDTTRARARVDLHIRQQELLKAELANIEKLQKVLGRIKDPELRRASQRNLASALLPFVDGRYPRITTFRVDDE